MFRESKDVSTKVAHQRSIKAPVGEFPGCLSHYVEALDGLEKLN